MTKATYVRTAETRENSRRGSAWRVLAGLDAFTSMVERFRSKVEVTSTCWLWQGFRAGAGYGGLRIGSAALASRSVAYAHRIAWAIAHGGISDDINVLHRCDNPPCVRVSHLFLGTQKDNVADMIAKGRGRHQRQLEVSQ